MGKRNRPFNIDLPKALRGQFDACCILLGIGRTDAVIEAVTFWVSKRRELIEKRQEFIDVFTVHPQEDEPELQEITDAIQLQPQTQPPQ